MLNLSIAHADPTETAESLLQRENVGNWYLIQSEDRTCVVMVVAMSVAPRRELRLVSVRGNEVFRYHDYHVVAELTGSVEFDNPGAGLTLLRHAISRYQES